MRVYSQQSVYDAALDRMRWIFDEFPHVVVAYSGGKDSTVIFELAMQVAKEKNRLPLPVMWIDQEAEWLATVDQVKSVMYNPDVEPFWLQAPFLMENSSSSIDMWRNLWGEGEKWIRPKDPIAIHDSRYYEPTIEFYDIFNAFLEKQYPNEKACYVGGVRAEESPNRYMGLTGQPKYKYITWGKILNKKLDQYTFYPIYDWSYIDIWKAIHDHGWEYCEIYDKMYQQGVDVQHMRVSNLHHATALTALYNLQEFEPENYEAIVQRMSGIDTIGKLGKEDYYVTELPFMFDSWVEYRDYLTENLLQADKYKESFKKEYARIDRLYGEYIDNDELAKMEIQALLANDIYFVKIQNWESRGEALRVKKLKKGQTWL